MANLQGKLEAEVELKSPADKFFKFWRSETHKMPTVTSKHIQGIKVHEGDWDQHGAIKIWNYTVDGKSGTFKEKVEFDDNDMSVTLHGIEGHLYDEYKVYRPICKVVPKGQGSVAKLSIEYEKYKASDPNPDKYMAVFIDMTKDIDAHVSSA
ncbi:MLP-like protein 328 [Rhodamnia argentea]|uniref:MLP-like protein 328 n=1 Tax=Rhodamnia argentea TaxID=178133 RepID=A0A8B8P3F1_9MYRT|nr:MLP-like protein 328 [Rhodamnia argentea]